MTSGGRWSLAACVVLVVAGLAFQLGSYPLLDPDEGRNAEVAREMAASNDYLLPRLDGIPYVDKPVLFFAASALAMEALGPTALAARLSPLLFTVATLALVWWLGRRLFGEEAGWIAAIATGASPLTLAFARTAIFDSALTFFVTGAVVGFYIAAEETAGRLHGPTGNSDGSGPGGWWPALAWGSIALGVLTKGPIALALPLMIAIPYLAWRKTWKALLDPVGLLLFLALTLPWVRYMSEHVPGYLRYVFVTETFQRLTTNELHRQGPWWYFVPILLLGALPWSVIVAAAVRRSGSLPRAKEASRTGSSDAPATAQPSIRPTVLLLLWILVPLAFFSLSQSKRPQYVLPLVPAIGLLVAGRWTARFARAGGIALATTGLAILLIQGSLARVVHDLTAPVAAAVPGVALPLGIIAIAAGAVAYRWSGNAGIPLIALSLPVTMIPFLSGSLMETIGHDRSARDLALGIGAASSSETEVVGIAAYPLSLPFYLDRTITLSTDSAAELTSNYAVRHLADLRRAKDSPLRPADWWREAAIDCERPRVFVVASSDRQARAFLAEHLPLIADAGRYVAYGPCGMTGLAGEPRLQPFRFPHSALRARVG